MQQRSSGVRSCVQMHLPQAEKDRFLTLCSTYLIIQQQTYVVINSTPEEEEAGKF
jgi:hypothetical protein